MLWKTYFFFALFTYIYSFFPPQNQYLLNYLIRLDLFWILGMITFTIDLFALYIYVFKKKNRYVKFWQVYLYISIAAKFYFIIYSFTNFTKSTLLQNIDNIALITIIIFVILFLMIFIAPYIYVVYRLGKRTK